MTNVSNGPISLKTNQHSQQYMGWHQELEIRCTVHPDFLDFYRNEYIRNFTKYQDTRGDHVCNSECDYDENYGCAQWYNETYINLPKSYKDILECWISLDIGPHFYEYDLIGSNLTLRICKKANHHEGNLWMDYETFLHDVIVPTTTEITYSQISEDDFAHHKQLYTDLELRGRRLHLQQLIRSVHHLWVDGAIAETRVIYKRGIPASQELDLERLYTRGF